MSFYQNVLYESSPSQLDLSRTAAVRFAQETAVRQLRADRRLRTAAPVRRLRRAVARYLVTTARLVDAS